MPDIDFDASLMTGYSEKRALALGRNARWKGMTGAKSYDS